MTDEFFERSVTSAVISHARNEGLRSAKKACRMASSADILCAGLRTRSFQESKTGSHYQKERVITFLYRRHTTIVTQRLVSRSDQKWTRLRECSNRKGLKDTMKECTLPKHDCLSILQTIFVTTLIYLNWNYKFSFQHLKLRPMWLPMELRHCPWRVKKFSETKKSRHFDEYVSCRNQRSRFWNNFLCLVSLFL